MEKLNIDADALSEGVFAWLHAQNIWAHSTKSLQWPYQALQEATLAKALPAPLRHIAVTYTSLTQ